MNDVDERVPEDHERRIRDGLGALLATPSAAPQTDAPSPSPSIPGVLGKWLTVGVVVGAAVGGFAAGRATAPATTTAPVATATPAATTAAASSTAIAATPSTASPPLEPVPPTLAPAVATGSSTSGHATAAPPPTTSTDAFDREQSMLERARSALVRHDAAAAEQALDECERQFHAAPRHAEERDYLRIQALRERGDNARTRERARAFLTKYPTSLYRGRIEPLVE